MIAGSAGRALAADAAEVMALMPADLPFTAVVTDFNRFDKNAEAFVKQISPDTTYSSPLKDIKEELGIGGWIDFSQPMGLAQTKMGGGGSGLLWVIVPDFAAKVKEVSEAKEEEGVWHLPFKDSDELWIKPRGKYWIVATEKESLAKAEAKERTLGDEIKARADLLKGRDVFIHVNMDAVRPMALGGLAQAGMMAPMFAPAIAQQAGADPMVMMSAIASLVESVKSFVEQVSYIDVTIGMTESVGNVTIASGFKDGAIKKYLGEQKPAGTTLLSDVETQPFFLAAAYHFPGEKSPFFDYVIEKAAAAQAPPPGGSAPGSDTSKPADGSASAVKGSPITREFFAKAEGISVAIGVTPDGMAMAGAYRGAEPKRILELAVLSLDPANAFFGKISKGPTYEKIGSKPLPTGTVEEFAVKFDTSNPQLAATAQMYGKDPRCAFVVSDGMVRFAEGNGEFVAKALSSKLGKPMSTAPNVSEVLAALPAKRNAVVVIDVASAISMMGPMLGMPAGAAVPPGAPVGISASFSGEPARVDIHVPVQAIKRAASATKPQPPM